jgi:hypothetical protein
VENRHHSTGGASLRLPGSWTKIRESQDDFNGNYFVGYDRDRSQFLMIDADDPASEAYFTEGWHGKTLLLTSVNKKSQSVLPHRIQYDVDDSHHETRSFFLHAFMRTFVVEHQAVAIRTISAGRIPQVGINVAQLSSRKWQCTPATEAKPTLPWRASSW